MVKKRSRKVSKKNREEFENRMKDFGEEVEGIADKFGRRMEERGERYDSWFHRTFGIVGPFISSIFGLIVLVLITWVIALINQGIGNGMLTGIHTFLSGNAGLFFLIFMFFSYMSYFSRKWPRSYRFFSPFSVAVGAVIFFWIFASVLDTVNVYLSLSWVSLTSFYINQSLVPIFFAFLLIGYLVLGIMMLMGKACYVAEQAVASKPRKAIESIKPGEMRRLYRSGRDKILGGVCGGIAEYLGVDPVLIRILWVIGTFAWGFGVLLYIICWVIIPRNPAHRWK